MNVEPLSRYFTRNQLKICMADHSQGKPTMRGEITLKEIDPPIYYNCNISLINDRLLS